MVKDIRGKKILYIGVKFFGYEIEIKKMLESMGARVDFYNERPSNDFFMRLIIRLKLKKLILNKINTYYNQLIEETQKKEYDYVLIISPETIPEKHMSALRFSQANSKFILYMWDSFKNKNTGYDIIKYFDKIMTFDDNDAKDYDRFVFLPLYYIPIYKSISNIKEKYKYDYFLACTIHSDRYKVIQKLKSQATKKGFSLYSFLYFHSKAIYWGKKFFDPTFLFAKKYEFSFKPKDHNEIVDIISQSRIIIDIQHPNQTGLTNRTFEAIGAHKKLITTNQNIKRYDFYNPQNIFIIDRDKPILDEEFLKSDYQKPSEQIYNKYSLYNWLQVIFDLDCDIANDNSNIKLLVLGSNSFIAKNFIRRYANNFDITAISRVPTGFRKEIIIKDFSLIPIAYFKNQVVVINFVAIVHKANIKSKTLYDSINYKLTVLNAQKAKNAGVNLFIQMSSIAVYGRVNFISSKTPCDPKNQYGISKLKADLDLIQMQDEQYKVAIIRPPMVYGGEKTPGNMLRLINLADKKIPLPFKGVNNKRDFVNVKNLIQYIAIISEKKLNGIHLITDNSPVSTEVLLQLISKSLNKKNRLVTPSRLLFKIFKRIRPHEYNKLFESLEIRPTFLFEDLIERQNIEEGIQEMVKYYLGGLKK